jgi:hypothetical protein
MLDQKWRRIHRQKGQRVLRKYPTHLFPSQQLHLLRTTGTTHGIQLNMYDFHKTRQENHENAFKNLMFKKGCKYNFHLRRHMLKDIQRKDYKKNKDCGK